MDWIFLWGAFIGLLAVINPLSTAFVFLGITKSDPQAKRKAMAYKAGLISAAVLIVFSVTGSIIFSMFGITIEAFKIAGGILIAKVGFGMLSAKKNTSETERKESQSKEDVSIIPLAIPMLSGPGAITTMLVWTNNAPGVLERILVLFVPLVIAVICYFALINAKHLSKTLGETGTNVVSRLMGLIVVVMGIQFIINGLKDLILSLL